MSRGVALRLPPSPGLLLGAFSLQVQWRCLLSSFGGWGVLLEPGFPCLPFPSNVDLMLVPRGIRVLAPTPPLRGHMGPSVSPCEEPAPSRTRGLVLGLPDSFLGVGACVLGVKALFDVAVPLLWEVSHTLVPAYGASRSRAQLPPWVSCPCPRLASPGGAGPPGGSARRPASSL